MHENKPVIYIIKRKAVLAALTVFICMFIGVIGAFQYANYVDKRSNQKWCAIVSLFNVEYAKNPPTTETGRQIALAMLRIEKEFAC